MTVESLTLGEMVRNAASAYPNKVAFVDGDVRLTFRDFDQRVDALAAALHQRGLRKGGRVAALMLNQWEFSLTYFATVRLGAIIVPLNNRLVADELTYQINDAAAEFLVFAEEFMPMATALVGRTTIRSWIVATDDGRALSPGAHSFGAAEGLEALTAILDLAPDSGPHDEVVVSHEDPSAIWYTSGTTGVPKGAVVTHASTIWAATSLALATRMCHDSRLLAVAPMFHRGPTDTMHIACFILGMTQTMLRTFTPVGLLEAIEQNKSTHAFIVPAMTFAVLGVPNRASYDISSMQCWMSASAPLPEVYRTRMEEETLLGPGKIYNAYGITEALLIGVLQPEQAVVRRGSVGQAVPMCRVRILDTDGKDVPAGVVGEIVVCTPAMASDYVSTPEAWRAVATVEGGRTWYASGDLGRVDDEGYIWIVDRSKDMVISGGENVYSAEVEQVLISMPGVAEVAVIGTPDERWGEAVTAVIVATEGMTVTFDDVQQFCNGRLADYKRPRIVQLADTLPRNSFGKVLKNQLRSK